jgi:predicted Rossmann-fold nucleotide-binding protein
VRRHRGRTVEVESLEAFDALVAAGERTMAGWAVQDVDLRDRSNALRHLDVRGALFLGCGLTEEAERDLRARGALVFPRLHDLPFNAYRSALYTPEELYDGLGSSYRDTVDARVYAWSRQARAGVDDHLVMGLHDLAVDDALEEFTWGRRIVGVMGGHAVDRGAAGYTASARLARSLARAGLTVATGGGPGAMEAANLGAYLAGRDEHVLDSALEALSGVPDGGRAVSEWARAAFDVRRRWPEGTESLGIPTWFYGHEPPNAFASHIAKYFKNAVREDVLLHVCTAGIVFFPGAAGTVQEVFQDACENYYAQPDQVAPMVLVGERYWTEELPVWPLLRALATDRPMSPRIHLVDRLTDVLPLLNHAPHHHTPDPHHRNPHPPRGHPEGPFRGVSRRP